MHPTDGRHRASSCSTPRTAAAAYGPGDYLQQGQPVYEHLVSIMVYSDVIPFLCVCVCACVHVWVHAAGLLCQ